jgi:alpha-tubulin suppressor-like RCC1 family protein
VNIDGQLGDNSGSSESATPVAVIRGVVAISAGLYHACALEDGAVSCWGVNGSGELGTGTTGPASNVPVRAVALQGAASAISTGNGFTCALLDAGVWCWGYNFWGQLGNGTSGGSNPTPVQVSGLGVGVSAIATGSIHACAVKDGLVWCWGGDVNGQLGNGPGETQSNTPVQVSGLTFASTVSAGVSGEGGAHTCADNVVGGAAWCWGYNINGQLGNDSQVASDIPVQVIMGAPRPLIAAGGLHSCAAATTFAECWGRNSFGAVGDGSNTERHVANAVHLFGGGIQAIAAGGDHTCAIQNANALCWGRNGVGQLGDGTNEHRNLPVAVTALGPGVNAIDAGDAFTCALMSGVPYCWGYGSFSQIGNGTTTVTNSTPVLVSWDADGDGCTDQEENGTDELFGGDRNRFDWWDFFDVTGDRLIDLSDTLLVLAHFGHGPDDDAFDNALDRHAPDNAMPFRSAESPLTNGIDLTDALVNLASFGHDCRALP